MGGEGRRTRSCRATRDEEASWEEALDRIERHSTPLLRRTPTIPTPRRTVITILSRPNTNQLRLPPLDLSPSTTLTRATPPLPLPTNPSRSPSNLPSPLPTTQPPAPLLILREATTLLSSSSSSTLSSRPLRAVPSLLSPRTLTRTTGRGGTLSQPAFTLNSGRR